MSQTDPRDDAEVCLCFHVSEHKVRKFLARVRPQVASQLADCLGAGTGCGWCRPYLEQMHRQWQAGEHVALTLDPQAYAAGRAEHRRQKKTRSD